MATSVRAALAVVAVVALLAACGPSFAKGLAGRVSDRASRWVQTGKSGHWKYWLTVGSKEFRVSGSDFKRCVRGSAYPACAGR